MKLFNILLMNILLLGGLSLSTCNQAKAGEVPQNQKVKALQTEIKAKVSFPDELLNKDVYEKVTVDFKIKDNKSIEVIAIDCHSEFLKAYVKRQLESMEINNGEGLEGTTFQIGLLFEN